MDKKLRHEAVTTEHVRLLMADLRPADRAEAEAASGDAEAGLVHAICSSDYPTALSAPNGGLIAIYGVAPLNILSDRGALWLMGTTLMRRHAGKVLHDARLYIAHVREHYPALVNYVDARNTESVRWLAALGFTIDPPEPYGVKQLPFRRFHMGLRTDGHVEGRAEGVPPSVDAELPGDARRAGGYAPYQYAV